MEIAHARTLDFSTLYYHFSMVNDHDTNLRERFGPVLRVHALCTTTCLVQQSLPYSPARA